MKKKKGRLVGLHIYNDRKDRYIFYNIFNKKAYLINGDDDYKKYVIYQARFPLAIVIAFIILSFLKMPIAAIVVGLLIYVGMSVIFYTRFVPNLPQVKEFVKPNEPFILRVVEPLSNMRIIAATIMTLLIAILLFINIQITEFDELVKILNYILVIIAFGASIFFIIGYIMKNKKK